VRITKFLFRYHNGRAEREVCSGPSTLSLIPASKNVIYECFVDLSKVLLPSLDKNLGFMMQFAKVMDKDGGCFKYI
jgi:hypothetical protein